MRLKEIVILIGMVVAVLFAAGCISDNAPINETVKEAAKEKIQNVESRVAAIRFVELNLTDGSKAGGMYKSESGDAVTIIPLYTIDKDGFMTRGKAVSTDFNASSISTMTNITDPKEFINTTLAAQKERVAGLASARVDNAKEETKQAAAEKLRDIAEQIETGSNNES